MISLKRTSASAIVFVLALSLSACQTTGSTSTTDVKNSRVAGAMASAARDAAGSGRLSESLAINEKLYHDNPNNIETILAYARDLRRAGRIDDAKLVIRTPALGKAASEPMLTEAALVMIAEGNYSEAKDFAEKAVTKDSKSAFAHQAMALALSGKGQHAEAEEAFKNALTLWPQGRDQTAVINNLAMSQAAQGKIKDARATMAMATGEALRSETYQNNRALLASLNDGQVVKKADTRMMGGPRAPQTANAMQALPVPKVEKQKIATVAAPKKEAQETRPENISPAAGDTTYVNTKTRPTPLFDAAEQKPWWQGMKPNENPTKRGGLNN